MTPHKQLVATDGVFSMDGDIAPLDQIVKVIEKFPGTYLFVDECHASGFLGATGRGTDEACGVQGRVDIINSTLGKALGGATGALFIGKEQGGDVNHALVPFWVESAPAPNLINFASSCPTHQQAATRPGAPTSSRCSVSVPGRTSSRTRWRPLSPALALSSSTSCRRRPRCGTSLRRTPSTSGRR